MKRRESLDSELGGSQLAPEIEREERNREKMVVTIFGEGKIIFVEMDKL
jgi:hypothetical protein